jgi:hypothetical protein
MNSHDRHQTELTVRSHLRDSINKLQEAGKSFDEMRGFVARFVEEQLFDLSKAHKEIIKTIPQKEFIRSGVIKHAYDQLCLALQNCRDGIMTEIKYREEKNAQKEAQPKQQG